MDPTQALTILSALANGIDPTTGEMLEPDSPLQSADVIRALCVALHAVEATVSKTKRSNKSTPNAGATWSEAEDQQLVASLDCGLDLPSLAKHHGRSIVAIQARLERHGRLPARASWRGGAISEQSSTTSEPT